MTRPGDGAPRLAAAFAAAALALASAPAALAHAGERGFIMLLPTRLFQVSAAAAVAASFLVVVAIRPGRLRRAIAGARLTLFDLPRRVPGSNLAATVFVVALVVAGFAGSRDPLANPLPTVVWSLFWVGTTLAHAVLGNFWPAVNPWSAPAALVRRLLGLGAAGVPCLRYPPALGGWPAAALLAAFAWFENIHPSPHDPAVLGWVVAGYSVFTVAGMALFGDAPWCARVEVFSCFFRLVSAVAPLGTEDGAGGRRRLVLTVPGARLLEVGALPASGIAFVAIALASISFDGLVHTFWYLDLVGANPLEHPGRTALVVPNTVGLVVAPSVLALSYAAGAAAGAAGSGAAARDAIGRLIVSLVPIALGYYVAHYLPAFILEAQYAVKSLSDPLARGWDLLGTRDLHVRASFTTHHAWVERVWYVQVASIVTGHVAGVVALHCLAGRAGDDRRAAMRAELPLTALMVVYTSFGLWLLSTPTAS